MANLGHLCKAFKSARLNATVCVSCGHSWENHSQTTRSAFFVTATPDEAQDLVTSVVNTQPTVTCIDYMPAHSWVAGDTWPACKNCKRPARPDHTASIIMKGVTKFRAEERNMRPGEERVPCGHFNPAVGMPGLCQICGNKWIAHKNQARTLAIEAFPAAHQQSWCKCIIMNGDIECSCLTDVEKQDYLDKVGNGTAKENKVSCRLFKSRSAGNTKCAHCGEDFYKHTNQATQNYTMFQSWHAANMTDKELLEWFTSLAATRDSRIATLRKLLTDPTFIFTPPKGRISPSMALIAAVFESLTGEHAVSSTHSTKRDIPAKVDGKDIIREAATQLAKIKMCYSCGEAEVEEEGDVCETCAHRYQGEGVTPNTFGPALRVEVKAGDGE
jgi:hypothetical protein